MTKKLAVFLLAALTLSSCSLFKPRDCNPESAQKMGYEDALAGSIEKARISKGSVCKDEYSPSSFQKDYLGGYQQGILEACQTTYAEATAARDASAGPTMSGLKVFGICGPGAPQKKEALEKIYKKKFGADFCVDSRAQTLGKNQGSSMQAEDFSTFEAVCNNAQKASLKKVFATEHKKALQDACSPIGLSSKAIKDARAGATIEAGLESLKACPSSMQSSAVDSYSRGFNDTRATMMREEELRLAQERSKKELALREQAMKLEQDRLNAAQGGAAAGAHLSGVFVYEGHELLATCELKNSRYYVTVKNLSRSSVTIRGYWVIDFYNANGAHVNQEKDRETLMVFSNGTETFNSSYVSMGQPVTCRTRFAGE